MVMINKKEVTPAVATHPGEILKDELESRNISQSDFSKQIGLQKSQLNEIINGKRGINAELALLISESLKIDAEYWMNAQTQYELDLAKINKKHQQRIEAIAKWKMIEPYIPVPFYKAQNIISGDPIDDIPIVKDIYKINSFEELAGIYTGKNFQRFRKSDKLSVDKINFVGWVKLVEHKCEQITVSKFDHNIKSNLLTELNSIIYKNKKVKDKVVGALKEAGIKIVYQEKYEKTPIDGVSFWSEGNPAIGLTLRHNRIDNFAFTLFHELGHVYLHLINDNQAEFIDIDKNDADYKNSKEEKEADEFAVNNLIDKQEWNTFFIKDRYYSDKDIIQFARKIKINPAIVKGRICHETGNYIRRTRIKDEIK